MTTNKLHISCLQGKHWFTGNKCACGLILPCTECGSNVVGHDCETVKATKKLLKEAMG